MAITHDQWVVLEQANTTRKILDKIKKRQVEFIMVKKQVMWLMAQLKEYISAVLWRYDDLILLGWKVCIWMVEVCILIIFHNVIML